MARPLIHVPRRARKGEVIDIKLLISHPMESGQRRDDMGRVVPRLILHDFICMFDGALVMQADLFPAIAANPFLAFSATVQRSGNLEMRWTDDLGVVQTEIVAITVE
jgi:sulfur-oxidizing protein SoxZ